MQEKSNEKSFFLLAIGLAFITTLIFFIVTARVWNVSDYPRHIFFATTLAETSLVELPHTAYQQFIIILRAIIPFSFLTQLGSPFSDLFIKYSYQISGFTTVVIFQVILSLLIFDRVKKENIKLSKNLVYILCLFTPIVLELLAPINFFTLSQRNLYIGYVGINVYHNPTIVLLKPVSLLLFWIILDNLELKEFSTKTLLLSIFLVLLDLTIKPNFMLCFLPSIWIYCVWRRFKKQPVNWILLIFGVTLPAILVLLAQYFSLTGLIKLLE